MLKVQTKVPEEGDGEGWVTGDGAGDGDGATGDGAGDGDGTAGDGAGDGDGVTGEGAGAGEVGALVTHCAAQVRQWGVEVIRDEEKDRRKSPEAGALQDTWRDWGGSGGGGGCWGAGGALRSTSKHEQHFF